MTANPNYSYSRYRARHGITRETKPSFYVVTCPYCGAEVGRPCFRLSLFKRRGVRQYIDPHASRIKNVKLCT